MVFDIEGARKAGYSDDEIIDHLATQQKDFDVQGARTAGYSAGEILDHLTKSSKSNSIQAFPSFEAPPREIPTTGSEFLGDLAGGVLETPANFVGQLLGLVPGGINAAGHALGAAAAGVPIGPAAREAFHKGMDAARVITGTKPETFTGQRFDETFGTFFEKGVEGIGASYEYLKRAFDLGLLEDLKKTNPQKYKDLYDRVHTRSGEGRRIVEGAVEAAAYISGARHVGKSASKWTDVWNEAKERRALEAEIQAKLIQEASKSQEPQYIKKAVEPTDQAHATMQPGVRAPQYGMGEVPNYIDRDMFGQPEIRPPVVEPSRFGPESRAAEAAIDAQRPRSPYDVQETPAQLRKMNESDFRAPDPNRPFYGDNRAGMLRDLPTREEVARAFAQQEEARTTPYEFDSGQGLDPRTRPTSQRPLKYQEVPVERPLKPGDPLPYTREPIPDPTTTPDGFLNLRRESPIESVKYENVYPNDKILRGMQENLTRQEARLSRLVSDQERLYQEGVGGKKGRAEMVRLSNSIEAAKKSVEKLRSKVEQRLSNKEPKLGRGPGRRQQGAINPEVFREGFKKIIDIAGKNLRLVAQGGKDKLSIYAYSPETREIAGRVDFVPSRGGLVELKDRNLHSAGTEVEPQFQRQGLATEMYKFARDLGNDIEPSQFQTEQGKAMWKGFEAKGVPLRSSETPSRSKAPLRQRGAINPEVFLEGFEKVKEILNGKLVAYSTREEYGPIFRISARDASGTEIGSAAFIPTRGGLKTPSQRDLLSALTKVDPKYQRQGIATEIYKFAHELGNDIVPSTAQTMEGKAMWDGFKAKGVLLQSSETPSRSIAPLRQRGAIHEDLLTLGLSKLLRKSPKDEPKVQVPDPYKRQSLLEMASNKLDDWKEFWRKEGPELKDIPDNLWTKSIEYFSNAQMLYHDTKNPMVKWLADTIANEKALANLKSEYGTQGVQFDSKGILPKKIINPNSPYAHWVGLSQNERRLVTDIINKYSGNVEPTPDMMRAMGANQKVINALDALQQPIKEVLSDINKQLIELGRNPIKERPFYFMRNAGQGNWLVRVVDSKGESVGFHRVQTKGYGEQLAKDLLEKIKRDNPEIGELKTEVVPASNRTSGNKYNVSTTLLEDIYQALERNDPRREVITSAIADIKSKSGYGAHRAFRKGVQGMDNTPREFYKTYEKYIEDGYNYESGQRLANLRNQIELTSDIPPGLKTWALEYLDRARGGEPKEVVKAIENGLDRVLSTITGNPIIGDRFKTTNGAARRLIKNVNYGFTTQALFFFKVPFLAGQALQSTSFAPAVMSLYKNHGHTGSLSKAMLYGSTEMFNKSPEFTKIVDYLSARGKIDQALVHDMGFEFVKRASQTEGGAKFATAVEWGMGRVPAQKIEALNRVHAAAIGYHFLKDQLKGNELRAGVERFVDDVMGNYSQTDRPGIVTRHGIVGEAVAPLGTFANWYKGMTAVMLKEAAQGIAKGDMSKAAPFMHMWLSSALMAGIMAAPLMKEADWIWNQVKGLFGFNEKTPSLTETILTSGIPDTAKFGALTGATTFVDPRGMHVTGSMAAPEIMPGWVKSDGQINWKNAAPGVMWGAEAVSGLMKLATEVAGLKKLTVEDRRQALKDVFPSQFDAWFSNLDSTFNPDGLSMPQFKQGQPILSKTGQGTVRRNDNWDTYASIIGSGTIPEVTEKMINRDIKREGKDVGEKKAILVQRAVDAIVYGTGDLKEITKQAMEIGYTNFDDAIKQAYQERFRTEAERSVGRGTTLQQYENHQYIKRAVGQ